MLATGNADCLEGDAVLDAVPVLRFSLVFLSAVVPEGCRGRWPSSSAIRLSVSRRSWASRSRRAWFSLRVRAVCALNARHLLGATVSWLSGEGSEETTEAGAGDGCEGPALPPACVASRGRLRGGGRGGGGGAGVAADKRSATWRKRAATLRSLETGSSGGASGSAWPRERLAAMAAWTTSAAALESLRGIHIKPGS